MFGLFGVQWVMVQSFGMLAGCFWRVVPHCVKWCLWGERNAFHFEDCETVALGLFSISSLVELIDFCTFHGSFYCLTEYF